MHDYYLWNVINNNILESKNITVHATINLSEMISCGNPFTAKLQRKLGPCTAVLQFNSTERPRPTPKQL